ncbi:hypothetical protein D5071_01735 [Pectobacterium carotovorum]|uniref:Uncharacterized protein n=1 Tax=Pectobacterium carotovorum TaxID=554 RepID=A0A419B1B7_PECCA|nr:hypothetical protein D5071_01735 [Pectobacterium carotovorum]
MLFLKGEAARFNCEKERFLLHLSIELTGLKTDCDRRNIPIARTSATLYPSYFKLLVRWLPLLTPVTYLSKLLGIRAVAAFTQLELFRVYNSLLSIRAAGEISANP